MVDLASAPKRADYWTRTFEIIDELPRVNNKIDQKSLSWKQRLRLFNILGFVLGPIYYLKLKMYQRAAILFCGCFFLLGLSNLLEALSNASFLNTVVHVMNFAVPAYCSTQVAFDYYQTVRDGKKFVGPSWLHSNRAVAALCAGMLVVGTLFAVVDSPSNLLDDFAGVWRDDDGGVMQLNLGGKRKTISVVGGPTLECSFKSADTSSGIVVLNCATQGKRAIVAIRKIEHADGSMVVSMSINDSAPRTFSYVRPL